MTLRQEFIELARQDGANKRELCRRFGISPKTAYKWLKRLETAPADPLALHDHPRRPHSSPARSPDAVEQAVLALRRQHPAWGGRKIARRLADLGQPCVAPSTVTHILHRHGLISAQASQAAAPWLRFEHDAPNSLWQIDFKGHFPTQQGRCHALTLLDDHSRFNLLLHATRSPDEATVQAQLTAVMRRYGLPLRVNADNGSPWGSPRVAGRSLSALAVWLILLGVRVSFSAPHHPQTNGKLERFHRSLDTEVLAGRAFADAGSVQQAFDTWREVYNGQRPHDALGLGVPLQRYRASALGFPDRLRTPGEIVYPDSDTVVTVGWNGAVSFKGRQLRVSSALVHMPIGIRADAQHDGLHQVFFCHQRFTQFDLRSAHDATGLPGLRDLPDLPDLGGGPAHT